MAEDSADALKAQGNEAFVGERWAEADEAYSRALALAPDSSVLLGNRSAARCKLERWEEALADADAAVAASPTWLKGYHRRAVALGGLGRLREAVAAYDGALAREPDNAWFQRAKRTAQAAVAREDASKPVDNVADWAERFACILEQPMRLCTLAHFWNYCTKEERYLAFARLLDILNPGGAGQTAARFSLEYMMELPLQNYEHLTMPPHWTEFFQAQDAVSRVQILEDMYQNTTQEERTLILHDLQFFIGGAAASAASAAGAEAEAEAEAEADEGAAESKVE